MAICDGSCDGCYGCRLRAKGVMVSPAATPNRRNKIAPRTADPAWERGIAGEHRPGGFMPYLNDKGSPIHVKEAGERRTEIDARVHQLRNDPNVFAATGGHS